VGCAIDHLSICLSNQPLYAIRKIRENLIMRNFLILFGIVQANLEPLYFEMLPGKKSIFLSQLKVEKFYNI